MWFPRLAADREMRQRPSEAPLALSLRQSNTERIYDLNAAAEACGLARGMSLAEARAFCLDLRLRPADPAGDLRFLHGLRRWATRYCPWVGIAPPDGLTLDITGSAHLWGGEAGLLQEIAARMERSGIELRLGLGSSLGAAWAMAHFGPSSSAGSAERAPISGARARPFEASSSIIPPGKAAEVLAPLPVAALRLPPEMSIALQRLGLHTVGDLLAAPRAPLARRFGQELLTRLDQALGVMPEPLTPLAEPVHYAVRMTLPEPIGLLADVEAGLLRLLEPLCAKLTAQQVGARSLCLTLRRVDGKSQDLELRLASAMRDPARIAPLFSRLLAGVEAGFGIDQLRLEASLVEPLRPAQLGARQGISDNAETLVTRIGTRIGLENILRFQPNDSHLPENSFRLVPVADTALAVPLNMQPAAQGAAPKISAMGVQNGAQKGERQGAQSQSQLGARRMSDLGSQSGMQMGGGWSVPRARPLRLFPPEPIGGDSPRPPPQFRWRGMRLTTGKASGPERIAPEWWAEHDGWRGGLRDYWQVNTREGRRLWLFFTPQAPGWFVQGEFL